MDQKELDNRFSYHAPKGDQTARYETIRSEARHLASVLDATCPDSREKSLAMTHLEQAVMMANASIARRE